MNFAHETYAARMQRKITAALAPILLEIQDDSAHHAGHAGHNPLGETHFNIKIVSAVFDAMPLVARHRAVYAAVAEEMAERVHALSLTVISEQEYNCKL